MIHFKRTVSALSLTSVLLLSACGGGGSSSGGGMTAPLPVADTTAPNVSFSPAMLSVQSGLTASATLTATDNRGVTTGPTASCTNGGSFDVTINIFTAAAVTANTTSVCTATASDAAGNQGSATLTVTMTPPPDMTAPVLSFSPETLTVESGATATATLSATDNIGIATGPTVTCTNGGSFDVAASVFTSAEPADVNQETVSVCTAVASDAAGNESTVTLTATMTPQPPVAVTLSGKLTYDRVPFSEFEQGLDYNATFQQPIRYASVELLDASGAVLDSTVSDGTGDYSFTVESGQDVSVRVWAEIQKSGANDIDLQVVDDSTRARANKDSEIYEYETYSFQGSLTKVSRQDQNLDLTAGSGWGGTSYTSERAAAPFAILDTIYLGMEALIDVDSDIDFPAFDVHWRADSTLHVEVPPEDASRFLGPSSYLNSKGGSRLKTYYDLVEIGIPRAPQYTPAILVMGDDDTDTDEYDTHVILHAFAHYLADQLSRSDNFGGVSAASDKLDLRVAFGEGFGAAFAAMVLDDPIYRDSGGAGQAEDLMTMDIENDIYESPGWFSQGSVQSILYDLYDSEDDGADSVSYGLGPIYEALISPVHKDSEAFTSIYTFIEALNDQDGVTASDVAALVEAQSIFGVEQFGLGETNDGGNADMLPIYKKFPSDGSSFEVCSIDDFGYNNKLGNRQYYILENENDWSNFNTSDAYFSYSFTYSIYLRGQRSTDYWAPEVIVTEAGIAILDAAYFGNIGPRSSGVPGLDGFPGDVCFNITQIYDL